MAKAEIEAGAGLARRLCDLGRRGLQEMHVHVAAYWREYFKPWVARMAEAPTPHGLPVIYHGCGNVKAIFAGLHRDGH